MAQLTVEQALQVACQHHQAGQLQQAEMLYRQILAQQPENADALHLLGVIAWQRGRHDTAVDLSRQAIALKPNFPEAHLNLGIALRDQGQLDAAVAAFRQAIALTPNFAKAHSNLGIVLQAQGRLDEAIVAYRQAIILQPNYPAVHTNLGNALQAMGRLDEAIAAYRQAIASQPNLPEVHTNLGNALQIMGRLDEAIAAHRQAISLKPNLSEAYSNLGNALQAVGRLDEAIAAYRQAIALDPGRATTYHGLAHTLEIQGNLQEAIATFKIAQELAPSSVISGYNLAALGVGEAPPASPREYLLKLFNEFSEQFEQHLVQKLEYKGPQLLFEAVTAAALPQPLDILDLGCGTGLCGALFRPMARHLTGVDVSPRMIEKSRQRCVYDELREEDLTLVLRERPRSCDLILAADVFIYVGYLDEVFEAAAMALRPGGLLAFTIENLETGDYLLRPSRRYAQSVAYIRRLALRCRFTEVSVRQAVLRKENAKPKDGWVIVLRAMET